MMHNLKIEQMKDYQLEKELNLDGYCEWHNTHHDIQIIKSLIRSHTFLIALTKYQTAFYKNRVFEII